MGFRPGLVDVSDAAILQTLARHGAEFVLRDVQPAAMLRGKAEVQATDEFAGLAACPESRCVA